MRERLADLETPVSAFAKLRVLGGAFLFESAEGGERMGRYSFIGVAPRTVLYFRGDEVAIERYIGGVDAAADRTLALVGFPEAAPGVLEMLRQELARFR